MFMVGKTNNSQFITSGAKMKFIPEYYKAIGIKTEIQLRAQIQSTQAKITQMNPPPDKVANSKADVIEELAQMGANLIAEQSTEVKAFRQMEDQAGYAKSSQSLVNKAYSSGLIPSEFSEDINFKSDLMNYIYDGSLTQHGSGDKLNKYNEVVKSLGNELFANRDQVMDESYSPFVLVKDPVSKWNLDQPRPSAVKQEYHKELKVIWSRILNSASEYQSSSGSASKEASPIISVGPSK